MVHGVLGAVIVLLGTINGGLGILYTMHAVPKEFVPYAVFVAIIWVGLLAFLLMSRAKRGKATSNDQIASRTDEANAGEHAVRRDAAKKTPSAESG